MAKYDWQTLLADDGPIADVIEGFQVRPQQQAMLEAVSDALETNSSVVIEAGTGVGKTFAYLLPTQPSLSFCCRVQPAQYYAFPY